MCERERERERAKRVKESKSSNKEYSENVAEKKSISCAFNKRAKRDSPLLVCFFAVEMEENIREKKPKETKETEKIRRLLFSLRE